ncbi:hypothetical protein CyaNS01_00292 [Cyanobium sp. NS01]|nr:hypothetical protein CyaNS01_00292 [Cyanobium sp. NS01]
MDQFSCRRRTSVRCRLTAGAGASSFLAVTVSALAFTLVMSFSVSTKPGDLQLLFPTFAHAELLALLW